MSGILIAGLGSIGRRHLGNLVSMGYTDIHLLRTRQEPLKEAPNLPVYTRLEEALESNPEIVLVSNPTAYHMDVALPAAEAGCHLFIEKPLAHTWDKVERLLEVVRANSLTCMVGFDLHFDPGLGKVRELILEGAIGRLTSIQAQVGQYLPDWHPWEDYRLGVSARIEMGGGVIFDLIHELDYVRWLMGEVSEIGCMNGRVSSLEIETEDTAAIVMRFGSGAIGTINLDYIQRVPSRSCRIIGEEGTILWDSFAQKVSWYLANENTWQEFIYPEFKRNDRFIAEMKHFLDCVRDNKPPEVDLVNGSQVLKLALLAKESNQSKKLLSV